MLKIDSKTGLARYENGSTGTIHSCHPNIHRSGSVVGMRQRGFWGPKDRTITVGNYIYNIDHRIVSDDIDQLVADSCKCAAC